jgi:predicted Fe-S protein YdhL (DUF1289 family)
MSEPEVRSPCISVCRLDPATRLCEGCFRTAAEIARWPYAEAEEKRLILERLEERRRSRLGGGRGASPPT